MNQRVGRLHHVEGESHRKEFREALRLRSSTEKHSVSRAVEHFAFVRCRLKRS